MRHPTRVRVLLAMALLLALIPSVSAVQVARAGGHVGTAKNDFTQVTPAGAMIYATFQYTSADQATNLRRLEADFGSQPGFTALLTQLLGASGSGSGASAAVLNQALAFLGKLFNGELGMAILPLTTAPGPHGKPTPHLHLLIDAGLQPGIGAAQLSSVLGLLGLAGTPTGAYRHLAIARLDLGKLLRSVAGSIAGAGMSLPATGSISGTFYAAVAGNTALLASDVPTIKQAIDTWFGAAPSLASAPAFQTTIGALPGARFLTLYSSLDLVDLASLLRALGAPAQLGAVLVNGGSVAQAYAVAAEPDGVLFTASPQVATGLLAGGTASSPTMAAEAGFLPDDTLAYAAIHDPGALLRAALSALGPALAQAAKLPGDPITAINRATGLNLDTDVFSWMHGDASVALLPVGAAAYGPKSPLTRISLVATLQVSDQGFVEAKLAKIAAALGHLSGPNGGMSLQFVAVPGPNGQPLHLLAALPTGIGYTFFHGYLMLGTALPADVAALERGNAGHNLSVNPLYRAALAHFGAEPFSAVFFVNLTHLRQTIERLAPVLGVNMKSYMQARPLLTAFKSLAVVTYPGANGGGAMFLGIGR